HKPLFANWLIEQVGTGSYPGLSYISPHLFRAWAVASGKIHEFPNDKAKWKTNFRCALKNLNKRFSMTKDNSKNSDDPHKVYEIIPRNAAHLQTLEQNAVPVVFSSPTESYPAGHEGVYPVGQQVAAGETELAMQTQPPHPPQLQPYYNANPTSGLGFSGQPSIHELEISVHYRKAEVLRTQVACSRIQLHYGHEAADLQAQSLCFPSTNTLVDHKQIEYTNCILNSVKRGLLLEVRDSGLYAYRQDQCRVFASTADSGRASPDPQKLPQNTVTELLNFEKYVRELKEFKENKRGSPEYVVTMCFGEKFPNGTPLEKKLIVVKVVPLICRYFHEMAQMDGASSLHSSNISLQISHDSLYDLISSVFGLPTSQIGGMQATGDF
ncbi:hypothetical protein NHX12_003596, partial [Muraenolepis orangiensis]